MKPSAYKWFMLALLALAFFFHQADRVLFGLLTIPIQDDLHLSDLQIGWVNTALFCTLAVATPFAGILGDRFSRKWIITASLLFWSLMTACTGFVGGICGLIFFRSVATGGGESFYAPSAYALIASHHRETRSIALSIHQCALYAGLMFSGALVAWTLKEIGGWRPVFMLFGGLGFLLGLVFIFALKDTPRRLGGALAADRPLSRAPSPRLGGALAADRSPRLAEALKAYFGNASALLASGGFVAIVMANNAYLSWAPKYVARRFASALGENAVGTAGNGTMLYHHLAAFAAIVAGGLLTDRLVRKYPRFRLLLQTMALLVGAPTLVAFGCAPTLAGCWVAVAAYGVCRGLFEVNTHASIFDVVAPRYRSTAVGMMTMLAFFLGSLSPLALGALSDRLGTDGLALGFKALGALYAVGAACMATSLLFTFKRDRIVE